jgi:hypothetical protein
MTEEHYNAALKAIEDDHKAKLFDLYKRFAIEATEIKIGDIVHDEPCDFYMVVEQVKIRTPGTFIKLPLCTFYGKRIKKDLTPTKILSTEYSDASRCKLIKKKST